MRGNSVSTWRRVMAAGAAAVGILLFLVAQSAAAAGNICRDTAPRTEAVTLLCDGIEKQDRGDHDGAISDFRRALELQPDLAEAHLMLGIGYFYKEDYALALAEYDQYLAVIPDNFHAWSNRAAAYLKSGNLVAARADIDRALALNPNDVQLLENRIVIAREADDLQTVIADCTWLIEHFPPEATCLMERGKALGAESRFAESLADLQRAVELEPTFDTYYFRGVTQYFLGHYEAAIEDFSQTLTLNPDFALAYLKRCSAQYRLQQYRAGLPDCDEFVRRRPDSYDGYYSRGILRSRAADQTGALADYRRAIELAGNPGELANAWYGVGVASERAGRKNEARDAFRRTIDIDPKYQLAHEALARIGK